MTWLILKISSKHVKYKISLKSTDPVIYNIRYIIMKSLDNVNIIMKSLDNVNIDSENRLYLIFNNVDGCTEEGNEDKCLIFD